MFSCYFSGKTADWMIFVQNEAIPKGTLFCGNLRSWTVLDYLQIEIIDDSIRMCGWSDNGKNMDKKVTQGVKPFKTRRYASLGGRDDLQMAGSFSRKIRIWSEIRASCQCNVRTFFLKVFATFCHIQRNQRVGRFADRTGAESKSLVLLKWIVLFRAFMVFQEKWADMNLWVCLRITQLAFESKIWITLSFQDLTCFFDYTIEL